MAQPPTMPSTVSAEPHFFKKVWQQFTGLNIIAKISFIFLVLIILLTPIIIAQQTNLFSHAGISLLTNCTPIPSGLTQEQIDKLSQGEKVNWCGQSSSHVFVFTDDKDLGHLTVENTMIKAVFHYRSDILSEHNNQGGGNLYGLYAKTSKIPTTNLIPIAQGGTDNSKPTGVAVGGIGNTEMYVWATNPNTDATFKADIHDLLGDNTPDAQIEGTPTYYEDPGTHTATISFTYQVSRRYDKNFPKDTKNVGPWYEIQKTWKIQPDGTIHLTQQWKLLRSGWFAEIGTRSQWSHAVGYATLQKYGHSWDPQISGCDTTGDIKFNGNTCKSNRWVTVSLAQLEATKGCGGYPLDGFYAQKIVLTGSKTAPNITYYPDNNGWGFEGSGLYQLNRIITNRIGTDSIFEECAYTRTSQTPGAASYPLGFYSWWGGAFPPANRYKYINTKSVSVWTDSYTIKIDEPKPTSAKVPTPTPQLTLTPQPTHTAGTILFGPVDELTRAVSAGNDSWKDYRITYFFTPTWSLASDQHTGVQVRMSGNNYIWIFVRPSGVQWAQNNTSGSFGEKNLSTLPITSGTTYAMQVDVYKSTIFVYINNKWQGMIDLGSLSNNYNSGGIKVYSYNTSGVVFKGITVTQLPIQ